MKNVKASNLAAMLIGIIGMGFGVYSLIQGQTLQESGYTLFIGLILFGTAFINYRQLKNKEGRENEASK